MRFRPANISVINRRLYLPRLQLTMPLKDENKKQPHRFTAIDKVTPYQLTVGRQTYRNPNHQAQRRTDRYRRI